MAVSWFTHHNHCFLVVVLIFISSLQYGRCIDEQLGTCGFNLDLSNNLINAEVYSGILKVELPTSFQAYQGKSTNQDFCDIMIKFGQGHYLQIELYYVDFYPVSSNPDQCSSGLEMFDSTNHQIYAKRLCPEGWEWEKRHRETKQEKKVIKNSPLTFRLISEGVAKGTGFKVHYNLFRPSWQCDNHREFKCDLMQRCVHDDITCDGWDDCGDDSDESEEAGCNLLTVSEIFAILIGVFLFLGTVGCVVVFLFKYRRIMRRNRLQRMSSKLALEEERRSMQEPSLTFPHRFNSMESMNKSQYSRQRLDIDSNMDKMSYRDNMSERSYKSASNRHRSHDNGSEKYAAVNRKNRGASQSSLTKEKLGGSRPDDLDKDVAEDRDSNRRDRRDDDRDSERRRRRRRYSDDEDDYDSDRERRRRRRSRERRRHDRSDDENKDDDPEGKGKSEDREKNDEDNDSDRERRRRRRSRDRRSYDRSSDEDYDSEDERRRRRRRRKRYDSDEDYDSEDDRRRRRSRDRRRYDRSSDEDYDSDRDRRRRRSRDRRRRDSDEYDSDRDRRRGRRSRDRSQDLSDSKDKDEKGQPRSRHGSEEIVDKMQEPKLKATEAKAYNQSVPDKNDNNRRDPYREREPEKPKQELNQPPPPYNVASKPEPPSQYNRSPQPPSTPPKSETLSQYNRRPSPPSYQPPKSEPHPRYNRGPQSNGAPPANDNSGNAWVPRSERKRNRRSRGEPTSGIYEDVTPGVQLENMGFREEAV